MKYDDLYNQLNTEQRQAVDTIEGPMMVLAGPGTGKTQLLSVRTANILKQTDLYPSNILILTFTNAGVKAMRERLAKIIGSSGYDVVVETFHGFANNLISDSEEAASIKGDRIEMTDLERITLLEYLLDNIDDIKAIRNPNAPYLYRRDIEANISALKRDGISPKMLEDFLKNFKADGLVIEDKHLKRLKAFVKIYSAYEEAKLPENKYPVFDKRGRYDYDDMIILATRVMASEPDLLAKYQEQFQYVMVDEFQDTNGSQLNLLKTLFADERSNVCVVGDDDQSIYRFQGASVGNFGIFTDLYTEAAAISLRVNYRSTKELVEKNKEIIRQIPVAERVLDKDLDGVRDMPEVSGIDAHQFGAAEEELTYIIREIKKLDKSDWSNTAVLLRTRKAAQDIIEAFLQAGIPYVTDGKEDIRGEFRVLQLIKILRLAEGSLNFPEKDLMLFEILLNDYWQIDYHDLMSFVAYVKNKKTDERGFKSASLFTELFLNFPSPERVQPTEQQAPEVKESNALPICSELGLKDPQKIHRASWVIKKLTDHSSHYPVFQLMMDFIQNSGLVDYVLKNYEDNEVLRLRELRSISSFVENLKKANQAQPGLLIHRYVADLNMLEKHEIPLTGEMVSSSQEGVRILTAHGAKGLEFKNVFIPFCVQDKAWPKRKIGNKIPLPHQLMVGQEIVSDKLQEKRLHEFDEIRLFYVAATRARDRLVFTAAPQNKQILSQFLTKLNLAPENLTKITEEETLIQILKKSPQPDPVKFTKDTLEGLVDDISLSPSSVNTYLSCRRKFLYQNLLRAPQPKTQALVYGQCIHKALEKCFRKFMGESTLPPLKYFETQFLQELDWHGVDQSIYQGCLQKLEDAKDWYKQTLKDGANKPLELERKITRKIRDGILFSGQFDKVEVLGDTGEAVIVDYKTGTPDKHIKAIENCDDITSEDCDDYFRQLVAYKLLYDRGHRPLRVTAGQLVFIDPVKTTVKKYGLEEGKFTTKTVRITSAMTRQYEDLLSSTWNNIKCLEFDRLEKHDDKKCNYCPYQGVCWK